ncbi:MAG: arginine--tRNA ligase, partial [Crenarchaeota archaeon]|nr:arginine--tRNA ligase [Thermoproteota archaeon]
MGFLEEAEKVGIEVKKAVKSLGYEAEVRVEEPPSSELGDIATPVAFDLAKKYGGRPNEIAEKIVNKINLDTLESFKDVKNVNGFINFNFNLDKYSISVLNEVLSKGEKYGKFPIVKKRILIEHTNSNPNKALHIGTLRNAVIGDVLSRFLKFLGHEVLVVNYIDDSGSQVAENIVAHYFMKVPLKPPEGLKFDEYSGKVYAEYSERINKDEKLRKLKSEVIRKIEEGNNEIAEFARKFSEEVVKCQLETTWNFGIFYDLLNWETDVIRSGIFEWAIKRLEEKGEVYIED